MLQVCLQVPLVISVWDDDYGISVHAKHQTTKENISEILKDSREMTLQRI
jgi:TPP-dependent pyruvate/acetoin dehydrogenase alpha subunit